MKVAKKRKCKTQIGLFQIYGVLLSLTHLEKLELSGSSIKHRLINALKLDSYWSMSGAR
jgi:hypothetical protein